MTAGEIYELSGDSPHNAAAVCDGNDRHNVASLAGSGVRGDSAGHENCVAVVCPCKHLRYGGHVYNALIVHRQVLKYAAGIAVHSLDNCSVLVKEQHIKDIRVRAYRRRHHVSRAAHAVCRVNGSLALCDSVHDRGIAFEHLLYSGGFGLCDLLESVLFCGPLISHHRKCADCADYRRRQDRKYQHNSCQHIF